jgi:hypothetical protein
MQRLIQIVYISRSTFVPAEATNGIEPNVARILMKSRTNNKNNGLVGVLYFGDGCFFQCLEGEEKAVDTLYAKLLEDPRHTDLKLLSRKMITKLSFPDWAMKYVPLESQMMSLLQIKGYKKFDPYAFDSEMTESVLKLLHAANDPSAVASTEALINAAHVNADHHGSDTKHDNKLAKFALAISIISIALSVFTLAQIYK